MSATVRRHVRTAVKASCSFPDERAAIKVITLAAVRGERSAALRRADARSDESGSVCSALISIAT